MPILKSLASKFTKVGKGAGTAQLRLYETWLRWAARGIQFIFALVVVGLYGYRVNKDRSDGNPQAAAWVYAVITGGLSCITCIVYAIPFVPSPRIFFWDLTLFILWIAVFGTFANIFLKLPEGQDYQGTDGDTMRHAVWLDLVNCLFWLGTGIYGCVRTFVGRKIDGKINKTLDSLEEKAMDKIDHHTDGRFHFTNPGQAM
ncbi:hypothetical protein F5Y15DRAFT_418567 [Xylariaceae sp. FL0016]|nr:hypothetical protein F5Y15DRAFT_418567 [Xylariaceae sp. FL0016]